MKSAGYEVIELKQDPGPETPYSEHLVPRTFRFTFLARAVHT